MVPTLRSRLLASAISFAVGFGLATIGLIFIQRPDQLVWMVVGAVFMVTGAIGVVLADSRTSFSVWAVLGGELVLLGVALPIIWLISLATSTSSATSLWPSDPQWGVFLDSWDANRSAVVNTLLVSVPAAVLGSVVGGVMARATMRSGSIWSSADSDGVRRYSGRRVIRWVLLGAVFLPGFCLAVPISIQATRWGTTGSRWFLSVCLLSVTVPLAWWVYERIGALYPSSLDRLMRANGARFAHRLRYYWLPSVAPRIIGVAVIVAAITAGDVVFGLALVDSSEVVTAPAQLAAAQVSSMDMSADGRAPAFTAAVGLWWLVPSLIIALLFRHMIFDIFKGAHDDRR